MTVPNILATQGGPNGISIGAVELDVNFAYLLAGNNTNPTATGSLIARTLADRFADITNILDFGADPTGSSDSSAALTSALTYAQGKSGLVYAPGGNYKALNVSLLSNTCLLGAGWNATNFFAPGNGTVFNIQGSAVGNPLLNARIENCLITGNGLGNTSNLGISSRWTNRCAVRNVRFFGCYAGYSGLDAWQFYLENLSVDGAGAQQSAIGYWFQSGGNDPNYNNGHRVTNCLSQSISMYGVRLENGAGSQFDHCEMLGGINGYYIGNPSNTGGTANVCQFVKFADCLSDTTSGAGWRIVKGTADSINDLWFDGIWAGLVTTVNFANIQITGAVQRSIRMSGVTTENSSYGVYIKDSAGVNIANVNVGLYDSFGTGSSGIVLENSTGCIINGADVSTESLSANVGVIETGTSNNNKYLLSVPTTHTIIGGGSVLV